MRDVSDPTKMKSVKRVVLRINPMAGRGRAESVGKALHQALEKAGHEVVVHTIAPKSGNPTSLQVVLKGAAALIVVGGDGTLHTALDDAISTGTPLYHVGAGTENLFAREFGMTMHTHAVCEAVSEGRTTEMDVGRCNGRSFALMCSVGFDAHVIHALARQRADRRSRKISHMNYIGPMARALFRADVPRVHVEVDGLPLVDGERGLCIVANSRHYAMRFDPAPWADVHDGFLDVVFMPYRARVGLAVWAAMVRTRAHVRSSRLVRARGERITIKSAGSTTPSQLDGETGPALAGSIRHEDCTAKQQPSAEMVAKLDITVQPAHLRVLLPADHQA